MAYSFAQNFEDVLLHRCFGGKRDGVYVDVGASSPINDSVTHLFYEMGWHGLNLDPLPERIAELRRVRPRDTSLCIAAGRESGHFALHRHAGTGGLSTLKEVTDPAVLAPMKGGWDIKAEQKPLSLILEEQGITQFDFLKVDAEEAEVDVLSGLDLERWRPAVVVVEATFPMTRRPSHASWEPILLAHRYRCVAFDGLNRFYLAEEHPEMAVHFETPANVHDGFQRFASLGPALLNEVHPDHSFAVQFAQMLLRSLGTESVEYLEAVMKRDLPPAMFRRKVTPETVEKLFQMVLRRRPSPEDLAEQVAAGSSGSALLRALLTSDEFCIRRARIAAG